MPSKTHLVQPIGDALADVSWDPDYRAGDPVRQPSYSTAHIVHEPLTTPRLDRDGNGARIPNAQAMQPRLAERWEAADDFREWTIHLRRGVLSNLGNELTAESVRWSWSRVYGLPARVGSWRSRHLAGVANIDDVEARDPYTVRFRLERPNPEFPAYLSFVTNAIVDDVAAKQHATDDDPYAVQFLRKNVAGFGAFRLDGWANGVRRYSARDDYWAGRPGIDSLDQVGVGNREEAMRLVERGEANMLLGLYPEELARFEGRPEFTIDRVQANHSTIEFNWQAAPFDDQRVRQAVCYALPYERIIDQVYAGTGRISKSPIPSVSKYHTAQFWRYDTDLAKARELLQASGHPDGFETQLYIQPSYESLRFGEIVRTTLARLGITVEVRFLSVGLPYGTRVPMWFKEECGHALYDPLYDLGHDYDPPPDMWRNKNIVDPIFTEPMRAIRFAPSADQPAGYRDIQRQILDFAPCAHIAEIETGWVWRGEIHPWAQGPLFLNAATTVWSIHRQILGWF